MTQQQKQPPALVWPDSLKKVLYSHLNHVADGYMIAFSHYPHNHGLGANANTEAHMVNSDRCSAVSVLTDLLEHLNSHYQHMNKQSQLHLATETSNVGLDLQLNEACVLFIADTLETVGFTGNFYTSEQEKRFYNTDSNLKPFQTGSNRGTIREGLLIGYNSLSVAGERLYPFMPMSWCNHEEIGAPESLAPLPSTSLVSKKRGRPTSGSESTTLATSGHKGAVIQTLINPPYNRVLLKRYSCEHVLRLVAVIPQLLTHYIGVHHHDGFDEEIFGGCGTAGLAGLLGCRNGSTMTITAEWLFPRLQLCLDFLATHQLELVTPLRHYIKP